MNYKEKVIALLNSQELSKEQKEKLDNVFPELKESEDERIRKEFCKDIWTFIPNEKANKYIAWLEKQGEKTHAELGQLEATKTSDQEPEPKFHPGDWVIDNVGNIYQIEKAFKSIAKDIFGYTIIAGGYLNDNDDVRLWSINDAKDGDVLASGQVVFIFKVIRDAWLCCHCSAHNDGSFIAEPYDLMTYKYFGEVHPATKEQRDLLFSKMKEEAYEWDAEKKELKTIESKKLDADEVIEWLVANIIDFEYYVKLFKKDFKL